MGANLDLYIDTQTGELLQAGAGSAGSLPTLTRNDSYTLRLRLLEKKPDGTFDDIDLTGATLKAAIGDIEQPPSDGSFKLSCNGTTSTAIPYNATAVCVYNAISNNVSTVSIYGDQFLLTASQPNTAMSFFADSYTLFPASTVIVGTRRTPATGINAQQIVRLQKNPAVYSDTFSTSPTTSEIVLTKVADGSSTQNETYNLNIGSGVRGGSFSLIFGSNSTTGIAIGLSSVTFQQQLGAVTGIGTSNISVQDNGRGGYSIQFVGTLKLTNIATALTLDASGVDFVPFKQTTLSLNTSELADLFTEADADTITPTLEIELNQNGTPKTILQKSVSIRKDLIADGSFSPSTGAQYYTKSECDALFVEDATTGATGSIDAANFKLRDLSAIPALDWKNRIAYDSSNSSVISYNDGLQYTATKIGFWGSAPVTQPNQSNVVTALRECGILAGGPSVTTYGIFPLSSRTLTTTASLAFGTVANNSSNSITISVTGAAINDIVLVGFPASVCQGLSFLGHVTTANVVEIDAVNATNSSIIQSTQTYRIAVIGY